VSDDTAFAMLAVSGRGRKWGMRYGTIENPPRNRWMDIWRVWHWM